MKYATTGRFALVLTLVSAACVTAIDAPSVAPLRSTINPSQIKSITRAEFDSYVASRSRLEPEISVDSSFWREVDPRVERTEAPQERPAAFLRSGVRELLQAFESQLLELYPRRTVLPFTGFEVERFFHRPLICQGSPCPVPACCGDGVRCWKCR